MDRIFLAVLNMSLTASFVITVVLFARIFLRRAPKVISYALWAVVLLNLICPFKPESAFSLIPFRAQPISEQRALVPGQELNFALSALYSLQSPGDDVYIPINPDAVDINSAPYNGIPMAYLFGYQAYLIFGSYIWCLGAAVLLLYAIISFFRLKRRVSAATRVDGNIYETDMIDSPFVLGIIRPRIYIPKGMEAALYGYIIAHERAHLKRRDYIVSVIAFAAAALHWFNPLVWIAYMLMLRDMESSVDEAVLRKSDRDIRCEYSSALLRFSRGGKRLSFPLAFGEQSVKERVKNVLNFKKPSRAVIVVAVASVAILNVGFAVNRTSGNMDTSNGKNAPEPEIYYANLNEEVKLKKGETLKLKEADVYLTVKGFTNSPPPPGAIGVWSGYAALFELKIDDKVYTTNTHGVFNFDMENLPPYSISLVSSDYKEFAVVRISLKEVRETVPVENLTVKTPFGNTAVIGVSIDSFIGYMTELRQAGNTDAAPYDDETAKDDIIHLCESAINILIALDEDFDSVPGINAEQVKQLFKENNLNSVFQLNIVPPWNGRNGYITVIAYTEFGEGTERRREIAMDFYIGPDYEIRDVYPAS